jgi:hypothetical protein
MQNENIPIPQQPTPTDPALQVQPTQVPLGQQVLQNNAMPIGMSASQMGLNQPYNNRHINVKKIALFSSVTVAITAVVVVVLLVTGILSFSTYKSVEYTSKEGTNFSFTFFSKFGKKQTSAGNTQLISKVQKEGKFPMVFSIAESTETAYAKLKDCSGYTTVFEVQNSALNQKIKVCDIGKQASVPAGGVYVAGFSTGGSYYVATFGQDYSSIDLSSQEAARESLDKFGLSVYNEDIKKLLESLKKA